MITIRTGRPGDAEAAREIVNEAYRSYIPRIGQAPAPMRDDYAKRIAEGQVWILDRDGTAVGILVLEETPERFLLDNIAVAPAHHGEGLGRALLTFAEQEAVRRGWHEIQLYTNALMTENIALYERIGYVETARVSEKGFDRVYMVKLLAGP